MRLLRVLILIVLSLLLWTRSVKAADDVVIRQFTSDITLATDDSLDITETIEADFDSLPNKHGFFRIIPSVNARSESEGRDTAITLHSITDETGAKVPYQQIVKSSDKTMTWKIGDAKKTITGLHTYVIHYTVQNVVRTASGNNQDELLWNLNGNFWQLPIEHYSATITFPEAVNQSTATVALYSGAFGEADNTLADHQWTTDHTLTVTAKRPLGLGEGITLSAVFPAGIVTHSNVSSPTSPLSTILGKLAIAGVFLTFIIPLLIFIACFKLWKRYGDDAAIEGSVAPEFAPPSNLRPLELGLLDTFGMLHNQFVAGTIVDLAVRGHLKIEEVPKTGLLGKKDWLITVVPKKADHLKDFESTLIFALGSGKLSEAGKDLQAKKDEIKNQATAGLITAGYLDKTASAYSKKLAAWAIGCGVGVFVVIFVPFLIFLAPALVLSGIILGIFAWLMPKRTDKGVAMERQIRGFQLYMKTAEHYRQQFFEKENIFERLLPYAIAFSLTKEWTKAVNALDQKYATSYAPVWYVGSPGSAFAMDSFSSNLNSLSGSISAAMTPQSSGGGGGGFSGGGGGGGGGGSW